MTLPAIEEVVRRLVQKAMESADAERPGSHNEGYALAELLRERVGRDYKFKTIQAWARGDIMPPAGALLDALRVTQVPVDPALQERTFDHRLTALEELLIRIDQRLEKLEAPG